MLKPLWKRRYTALLAGQTFSLAGSGLLQFSVIWWLTETTGSAKILATATVMTQIPVIILGPFAGVVVDRWPRKWILIAADAAMCLFVAALALLFWLDRAQIWHVYVIMFLRALADLLIQAAMIASTSSIVPRDQLARMAALRTTLEGALYLIAPVAGGLLLEMIGVQGTLPLAVPLAVLAVTPIALVTLPVIDGESRVAEGARGILRGLKDGWGYLVRRPGLWQLELTSGMWALVWTPAMSLIPLLVKDHFGGGALELGWFQSGYGLGLVAGGVILSVWGGFHKSMLTCAAGAMALGCAALVLASAPAKMLWLGVGAAAIGGLVSPAITTGFHATVQKVVDPAMQGRYWGLHAALNRAMGPLALAIAAPLADRHGVRMLWLVSAAGALLIGMLRRFLPAVYHLEDEVLSDSP